MHIKSVIFICFSAFTLGGFLIAAPAQSISMPERSMPEQTALEQTVLENMRAVEVDEIPTKITSPIEPSRINPYAVIEAARHAAEKDRSIRMPLRDIQQLKRQLNMAVGEAQSRLSEIKEVGLSPLKKGRDRLNKIQQNIKNKASDVLEHIGSRATHTAQQLRASD